MTAIAHPSLTTAAARSAQLEAELRREPTAFRVLTGDRPTGPLHIGHLFGTLENRVRLQRLGVELSVLIADYKTLTDRDASRRLPRDVLEQVADYVAVGIDPPREDLRPLRGARARPARVAVHEPRHRGRAGPKPDGQGRERGAHAQGG